MAVSPGSNTTDILAIEKEENGWIVTVQNTEKDTLRYFNTKTGAIGTVTLDTPAVHTIAVPF